LQSQSQNQGDIKTGSKDLHFPGLVLRINGDHAPVIEEMEQADDKKNGKVDVKVPPLALGQTPQSPLSPLGDPPFRDDIENDTGENKEHKGKPASTTR